MRCAVAVKLCLVVFCLGPLAWGEDYRSIAVILGDRASDVERNVGALLAERIGEKADVEVAVTSGDVPSKTGQLRIFLGAPANHPRLLELLREHRITPPQPLDPGKEGFVLETVGDGMLLAAADDSRGALYAAGEILRRLVETKEGIGLEPIHGLRSAPAFRWRGTEVGQSATMIELTGVAPWTEEQWRRVVLDYALAGANIFAVGSKERFDFLRSFDLMTVGGYFPNNLSGHPEWKADEPIGRENYVCLSYPEARRLVLEGIENGARTALPYDMVRIASGDPGGCWCERCAPWGKTYIRMAEDIAAIVHKYNPKAAVYATNQELDNAGDQAMFDFFNANPDANLAGLFFGPGCNAMSWNGTKRPNHRFDLFEYPAFGVFDRYCREMVHNLPQGKHLTFFTDLTHWMASQYGFMASWPMPDFEGKMPPPLDHWVYDLRPDQALFDTYNRRTFFVRPARFYAIFQETMRYGEGDITYSEGHHDQFNQWMWQRLLWNPKTSLDDVIDEYCRFWFGPAAAPAMLEAILQLEKNLVEPLAENQGIDTCRKLVAEAGNLMSGRLMERDYMWRMFMQKAVLDKYVQLRVIRQLNIHDSVKTRIREALAGGNLDDAMQGILARFSEPAESDEMAQLRALAGKLGEESGASFGVRNDGYFHLDQDYTGLGWVTRQLEAASTALPEEKARLLRLVANYEDPGEGGFYDDAGDPERSPHMTVGWPYSVNNLLAGGTSTGNLPSQRTMAYTTDERQGVTFEYTGLDPKAHYRVRFAFVRPVFKERFAMRHPEKNQTIHADDFVLAQEMVLPEWDADLFEYTIPAEATADGQLKVWLEPSPDMVGRPQPETRVWKRTAGWGTLVSDVWLIKE